LCRYALSQFAATRFLYGVLAQLYPVFLLHAILLPINIFKLARVRQEPTPVARAVAAFPDNRAE
jgi:hypothetical protein